MIRAKFPPEVLAALSSQAGMNFSGIKLEMDSSGFLKTGNAWKEESRLLVLSYFYTLAWTARNSHGTAIQTSQVNEYP